MESNQDKYFKRLENYTIALSSLNKFNREDVTNLERLSIIMKINKNGIRFDKEKSLVGLFVPVSFFGEEFTKNYEVGEKIDFLDKVADISTYSNLISSNFKIENNAPQLIGKPNISDSKRTLADMILSDQRTFFTSPRIVYFDLTENKMGMSAKEYLTLID